MTRILIIKPSSLGDIVHGLQLAASVRAQRPEVGFDWVARDLFAPLVQRATCVQRTYLFRRKGGVRSFWQLTHELRQTRYDQVWDLQGLLRSGLMTAVVRAPVKVGRADAREGAGWFYTRTVPLPATGSRCHALDILLPFARVVQAEPVVRGRVDFAPVEGAPRWHETIGPRPVLLFPDSRRPEKCWPHFAALTARLLADPIGLSVVWAGQAPQDADPDWDPRRFLNLTGRTRLQHLPSLIAAAVLVVGNDSGPMHLAAAMDVPVLGLFGPTDPVRYGPYPVGAPGRGVLQAPNGRLDQLTPERVAERISQLRREAA